MDNHKRVAFIGAGNMTMAIVGGLRRAGMTGSRILAIDPDPIQLCRISDAFTVRTADEPSDILQEMDVVVWAVKPQHMQKATEQTAPYSSRDALHLSFAAGIRAAELTSWLSSERIVRAMPNTPAVIGEGVCGLFASNAVSMDDRKVTEMILESTGQIFWVESEAEINAVTAVTGSGPAYVFHFIEGIERSALELGFNKTEAKKIVCNLVIGAARQALQDSSSLRELMERVTSAGGTTEAALEVLEKHDTQRAMLEATRAAFVRAIRIGEIHAKVS